MTIPNETLAYVADMLRQAAKLLIELAGLLAPSTDPDAGAD